MAISDAKFHTCSFIGDLAIKHKQKDIAGQNLLGDDRLSAVSLLFPLSLTNNQGQLFGRELFPSFVLAGENATL
ncbi:hypothetical protein [Dictyobacter alpinus]|uniref:hypothetical protein n=1 Tax=Dictyobacter alpinus TaxID=2014873 RepID=UPI000F82046D|nr:hypothetical protein [Dictyobacter alpinus]